MPKTANLLVVSEPGVGKTTNTKFIMKAIKDRDGQPSVFTIQMGKDTTIDDLMGPVKPSEIQNDRIVRAVENGLPGKKQAFFDEYFRAPIYTREGVLEYQANGTVSLGGVTYDSENILSVYASNMYPTQVFYRDGKDARAEIDRMLFTFVLLPTYESDENMVTDVEPSSEGLSQLYFDDIALLKDAAKKIVVPRYFRSKLKVLVNKLRAKAMIDEHESEVAWQRKMQEGHILLTSPEYNTRVLSPRSEGLAQLLLGRFAFRDWLNEGMPEDRLPEVTEKHFAELEDFFAPVSNSDEAIHRVLQQYADGSAQHQQFNLILKRRKEFASTSQQIERDVNRNTDIIQLENFAAHLKFTRKSFYGPSLVAADGQPFTLDADNATIVAEFLKWHKDLLRRSQQRGQIVEMQAQDVAMDKAVHYANRLLAFIKPSRE